MKFSGRAAVGTVGACDKTGVKVSIVVQLGRARVRFLSIAPCAALLLAVPLTAAAQNAQPTPAQAPASDNQETGIITYPANFFDDIRPTSALDMVQRIPGFTYNRGDTNVRGFAGSGGNVLIDGAPPTSKSVRLDDVLRRIPADNVLQVDLIRGGAPGIDMQGQSVVANVIRKGGASTTAAVEHTTKYYPNDGRYGAISRLEASRRTDDWSVEASFVSRLDKNGRMAGAGYGNIERRDGAGMLTGSGPYIADYYRRDYQANIVFEFRWPNDLLHVNFGMDQEKPNRNDTAIVTDASNVTTIEQSNTIQNRDSYELGSDFETTLFGLDTRLLALQRLGYDRSYSTSATRVSGNDSPTMESIFRATVGDTPNDWLNWEAGLEAAYNSLDANSSLVVSGVPQSLPNANVKVEEKRGEAFATANMTLGPGFRLESGLRWETSIITQSGDTNLKKSFTFPKPRAILTYDLTPTTQLRARVEREVGQLDFNSFASANDPSLGTVTAGNANLQPERSWVYEGAVEQRFWDKGAFVLTFTHYNVEQVNDQIPVYTSTSSFDAPGNIGDGTKDQLQVTFSIPFEKFGWPNAVLRSDNTIRWSEVTDPVTLLPRRISREVPISSVWTFTQDFPSLDSTLKIEATWEANRRSYRIREIRLEGQDMQLNFNWAWKFRPDVLVQLFAEPFPKRVRSRDRILYTGDRATGSVSRTEHLDVVYDPFIAIGVRKTF